MKRYLILFAVLILSTVNANAQTKLKLYGGKHHDQFLGCIDCSTEDLNSIWCGFGEYGSVHKANSIWNELGKYGSNKSDYSPFNKKAKYPPLVLDQKGKSYGFMTINKSNPKRSWDSFVNQITEQRDEIVKDIPAYHDRVFHDFHN
ncbi:hypothetical protein [Mucilaginibacter sp. NFX135]|uniref:hypothetical protein n=1 Tax=Mucilaginibacter sp. NFX135 TaxID=3402687 RepID=UPI003AFAF10F